MTSIVALDIETTGLDWQTDAIIEIGAVRFNGRRVEGEWSKLINPGKRIPPFVTQLTGITDQMVLDAPPIRAILSELRDFVGDAPILGHSVGFDLSFLRKYDLFKFNDALDTYEMASVLLPSAGRYNLSALGQALGIIFPATHRALDDAKVTRAVFQRLYEMTLDLPLNLLAEIVRHAEQVDWGGYRPFYEALRARSKETVSARQVGESASGPIFESLTTRNLPALLPKQQFFALDPDETAAILEYGGAFSHHFPDYEFRPQQVQMLKSVTQALSQGHHLMVEAGTGTGKSFAYLIPAALWAMQNGARVVISTNTINLQDQLINKDIPDLRDALGIDLRAAVMKGRSNYLCPRRLDYTRRHGPRTTDEMRVLAKILVWLQTSESGDRNELNLNGPFEREVWSRFSAEDDGCSSENCIKRGGICPFYRARLASQSAHILVVNHALLLADIATGSKVLPEYDYLIVDEAHHLEDATTNALSFKVTRPAIERTMRELGNPSSGLLGWVLSTIQSILPPDKFAEIDFLVQRGTDLSFQFSTYVQAFFDTLEQFLLEQREGRSIGMYAHQERILPGTRAQPAWADVEVAWDEAEKLLHPLVEIIGKLLKALSEVVDNLPEESEELFGSLSNFYRRMSEMQENINNLVFEPKADVIYWIEINSSGKQISLNAAPLHIGPMMQKYLWNEKSSVIMTSATLTTAGEFEYLRGRLYAETADELAVGSPFDYENAVQLYIANDIPEPSDKQGHQRAIEQAVLKLSQAIGGKALVLFTSYDQLKRTSQIISPLLARQDIRVYEQGEGASANMLLENFRSDKRGVLLGTRAFWEGVDIPGQDLSALVIVKLPFDVPSDPIIAARSETFEDPFNEYSLPEAILRFRQGFGRLIRTQSDRGVVAILDRRVMTKRYGRLFIDSLPVCNMRVGPLSDLPHSAVRWLNL